MFILTVSDGFYDSEPDTVYVRVLNATTPETQHLTNRVFISGKNHCFGATQTIIVAGSGTAVLLLEGSSSTFIAGNSIRFLPGFYAQQGCLVNASITTNGTFCDGAAANPVMLPEAKSSDESLTANHNKSSIKEIKVKIYPNPNNGRFSIETKNIQGKFKLAVFDVQGRKIMTKECDSQSINNIDINPTSRGLYYVKIIGGEEQFTEKILVY